MADMPNWEGVMTPTLRLMGDGEVCHRRELQPRIADEVGLTDRHRKEMLPWGRQVKNENRIGWAMSFMTNVGSLARPKRGHYQITDAGRELIALFPHGTKERDIARGYAEKVPTRIILIDGPRLADLMIRYGVGVQAKVTYTVVENDKDFFA